MPSTELPSSRPIFRTTRDRDAPLRSESLPSFLLADLIFEPVPVPVAESVSQFRPRCFFFSCPVFSLFGVFFKIRRSSVAAAYSVAASPDLAVAVAVVHDECASAREMRYGVYRRR